MSGKLHVQALQAPEDIAAGALQGLGSFGQVKLLTHVLEQRLTDQLFELTDL